MSFAIGQILLYICNGNSFSLPTLFIGVNITISGTQSDCLEGIFNVFLLYLHPGVIRAPPANEPYVNAKQTNVSFAAKGSLDGHLSDRLAYH